MKPEETTKPCDTAEEMQELTEPAVPTDQDHDTVSEDTPLPVPNDESLAETEEAPENADDAPASDDDASTADGSEKMKAPEEAAEHIETDNDDSASSEKPSDEQDGAVSAEEETPAEEDNNELTAASEDTEHADGTENNAAEPAAADGDAAKTKGGRLQKRILLITLIILAVLLCCALCLVLYLNKPQEPKQPQITRNTMIMAREMPTIPTDPPTEPPTEAPTEPPYEMKLDISKAQSYHTINEDVVGWVYIDDTVINYPVVQSDDNSYYMERNWQKQYSYSGSIFQDYACDLATTENTLLYGHNMGNGTMFHAIKNYKVEDWGLEHPYVEVSNLETRYLYKVISVNVLYGDYGAAFEYWNCKAMSSAAYTTFVQQIYDTSLVWYGGDTLPEYGDEILTLQTCNSGAADGMRCVLFAVRVGEF